MALSSSTNNMNIAFGELLPQILLHSTTSDLINYRLVSRRWRQEANRILLRRGSLKIKFEQTQHQPYQHNPTLYSFKSRDRRKLKKCRYHRKLLDNLPRDRTLSSLFHLLKSVIRPSPYHQISWPLPFNHFYFNFQLYGKNYPELTSFLLKYGPNIKTLTLDNHVNLTPEPKWMIHSILQYTPNIERLYVFERFSTEKIGRNVTLENKEKVILGHLKGVEIHHELENYWRMEKRFYKPIFGVVPHLLEIAPQLEKILYVSYFEPNLVDPFLPSRTNLLCVETLWLDDHDLFSGGVEALDKLVKVMVKSPGGIGLKYLRIFVEAWPQTLVTWKRGSNLLRRVLRSNVKTLQKIELVAGAAVILNRIPSLPVLDRVEKLKVNIKENISFVRDGIPDDVLDLITMQDEFEDERFEGNSFSRLFPNLETLDLSDLTLGDEDIRQKWFPFWNDKLIKVKALKAKSFNFGCPNYGMSRVFARSLELCPEFESFYTFWPFHDFQLLCQPLWNLTQLTSVNLEFCHAWNTTKDAFLDLDAALTGLSNETVSSIYRNWKQSGRWEVSRKGRVVDEEGEGKLKLTRVNSSILNLQNLQQLSLEIRTDFFKEPQIFVSGVSAKFAFDLMKSLKVRVVFNFNDSVACSQCDIHKKKNRWLELHRPLLSFSKVTLGSNNDLSRCTN